MKKKAFVCFVAFFIFAQKFFLCAVEPLNTKDGDNTTDSTLSREPLPEFSYDELRRILPELDIPFPMILNPLETFPDGKADSALYGEQNPWLYLKALQRGYPEVSEPLFDSCTREWLTVVNGKNFFWADGRILPETEKNDGEKYRPFFTYEYEKRIFEVPVKDKALFAKLFAEERENISQHSSLKNNTFFFAELYGEITEQSITENVTEVLFLGNPVYVHNKIASNLKAVNAEVSALKKDKKYKSFFSNHRTVYGFNWRAIEYSDVLSLHALGIAVDVMAKRYGKLNAFWYWESTVNDEWFMLTPAQRWMPPLAVIQAFNRHGFVWGGYWSLWDTMHFEYRPDQIFACDFTFSDTEEFYTEADIFRLEAEELHE